MNEANEAYEKNRVNAPPRGSVVEKAPDEGDVPAENRGERIKFKREREYVRIKTSPDRILIVILLTLVCIGSVTVFSASYPYAIQQGYNSYYYVLRQIMWVAVGLVLMTVAMRVPYNWYKNFAVAVYAVSLALLVIVLLIGRGDDSSSVRRWIYIGSVSFQPSEVMKFGLVLLLSWYIDKFAEYIGKGAPLRLRILYGVIYPAFIIFVPCGLVLLEKHLSGTIILFAIGIIVLFIGGASVPLIAGIYGSVCTAAVAVYLSLNSYALQRIITYFDENADALDEDWQTTQGLYAIGSGGLFGLGLGESRQKYGYVSQPQNDFIFTIWCEEMGYIGAVAVVLIFAALLWRGYTVARRAPNVFSSLLVYGIISHITLQAILNIMVVTSIIPNTGISLPFFSYGGSSLVMLMVEMGIVLSVSRHSRQQKL
ncbi:MAG: putative lipid II flippase FtsW [Clostridia bacterium]|nr:putative lipid II flippase FtsW [Clostridia bacterium]